MHKHLGIQLDIETLDTATSAIVLEICAVPFDMNDPRIDNIDEYVRAYLPMDPQVKAGRTVSADTFKLWMEESLAARTKLVQNLEGTLSDLEVELTRVIRRIKGFIYDADEVSIMCRGTDFDIPIVKALCDMAGLELPWEYHTPYDLRTIMKELGISSKDVKKPADYVKHSALSDCKFQILQYAEVKRRLEGIQ